MTKYDYKILQGVAICFMLFSHLFYKTPQYYTCYLLSRAMNPVAFFVILSGFGLYTVESYDPIRKIVKLYMHYLLTILIFVPLGYLIVGGNKYPGDFEHICYNLVGFHSTWNSETWFLLPYALLVLTSRLIFRIINTLNTILYLLTTFTISMVCMYIVSKYGARYLYNSPIVHLPFVYFNLLFAFSIGALFKKYNVFERVRNIKFMNGYTCWGLLIILIIGRCCINSGSVNALYTAIFIPLFVLSNRPLLLNSFLFEMGKRSTSMWLVHTYFCYYLFHDFIYGFKSPIVIFAVLLACSYASAVMIDCINGWLQKILFNK